MDGFLLCVIGSLVLVIFGLCLKIYLLQKSAQEIQAEFRDRLVEDTNILVHISSRDPSMRQLASDINAQLRLLRSQRQRYQKGDRDVKEAITNISHDLRTPLTAICGYLELMKQQELSSDAARYLAQIEERTIAMKDLTEELFRYTLSVSEQKLHLEPVDLRRTLEEALLSFYGAFSQKGITPALELADDVGQALLDNAALKRVLGNILANVLKYSAGDLKVVLNRQGMITFTNFAPGLDGLISQKLFDRYYTVDTARNSTGLGLSIARRLTEQMGGNITASYNQECLNIVVDFSGTLVSSKESH